MKITRPRLKRSAALAGLVGAAVAAALIVPVSSAQALTPIGQQPGDLTLDPASGPADATMTWSTTTGCPTGFTASANLNIVLDDGSTSTDSATLNAAQVDLSQPFSGTTQGTLSFVEPILGLVPGNTYEFVVFCFAQPSGLGTFQAEQSSFVTLSADGSSYTSSSTPPTGGSAVSTSTTLTADPTSATQGDAVNLTATVTAQDTAGNDAAGQVEFFNGATSLGTAAVANGTATMSTTALPVGDDSVTAMFEPTDASAFAASTSDPVTVSITAGSGGTNPLSGTETINVNVPQQGGVLALTVDNTPVQMTDAQNMGTFLESTGQLSPVTVSDARIPLAGWDLTGAASDFHSGANTIDGNDLGWSPKITTPNDAGDVTAGGAVAAGNPGLKTAAPLASADAGHGGGNTVLGADLDLQAPVDTPAGEYSATMTVTLISK
jgi:Big-like domain-containing protein